MGAALLSNKWLLTSAIVCSMVASSLSLSVPVTTNRLLDELEGERVVFYTVTVALLGICSALIGGIQHYLLSKVAETAVFQLRLRMINSIVRFPMREYDLRSPGDLVSRLGADTTMIRTAVSGGIVDILGSVIMIMGSVGLMAAIDFTMLAIVCSVVLIGAAVILLVSARLENLSERAQHSVGLLGANLEKILGAMRTIRASGTEDNAKASLELSSRDAYSRGISIARVNSILDPIAGFTLQMALVIIVIVGGVRVTNDNLSIGNLVAFIMLMVMFATPLASISSAISALRLAAGAISRVSEIVTIPSESSQFTLKNDTLPYNPAGTSDRERDVKLCPAIEFHDVSFSYDESGSSEPILDQVSWLCYPGEKVAIVGPSGSGKSTMLKLIERFYDVSRGSIRVFGYDVKSYEFKELRRLLDYLEQDAPVVSGTVLENLELSCGNVDDKLALDAINSVNLSQRFSTHGLRTVLGQRGATLSGGERQRLAAARLILSDFDIVLMDEPSASLDSNNEKVVDEALKRKHKGKTVIVIAHRLSTIIDADRIVVLDEGRVADVGRHGDLLSRCAVYRKLAVQQGLT